VNELWNRGEYMTLFSIVDILIDGRYDKTKPTKGLDYRGSTNQRAIQFKVDKNGKIIGYYDKSDFYFKESQFIIS
jgi:hypothetical protein